jgi:hypothetical protein
MNVKGREKFRPMVANIHFPAFQDKKKFTYLQDSVLRLIYTEMVKDNINVEKPDIFNKTVISYIKRVSQIIPEQ